MSEYVPLFLVHVVGFSGFLWLGLYALARGDRGQIATLTGAAALVTASFFFAGALNAAQTDARAAALIQRLTWWDTVLPITLWLHLSLRLNTRSITASLRRPVLVSAYGLTAVLIVLGMATNLLRDYSGAGHGGQVGVGPFYWLYVVCLLAGTGLAALNVMGTNARGRDANSTVLTIAGPPERDVESAGIPPATPAAVSMQSPAMYGARAVRGTAARLLIAGSVCFVLGAGYLTLNILFRLTPYELPAYILLLLGLGAVGATVVVQSALLLGKDVRRDALYSSTGLLILLALYLTVTALLVGFRGPAHGLFALVLAGLVTLGHTLFDLLRERLDQLFFSRGVREERAAARAYADALATHPIGPHPDLATVKSFDDAVRRALTHLSDPTKLATTPLLTLRAVGDALAAQGLEDNRLNRAAMLREILLDLLDGLRPADGSGSVTGDAWRYYNCLYYPYVRGIGRRRAPAVLRQLKERRQRDGTPRTDLERCCEWIINTDQDTWYKWQRRGSDSLSAVLREREAAVGGVVPVEAVPSPVRLATS